MTLYKLTDRDNYTRRSRRNETLWGPNVTHEAKGTGDLCSDGVIHAYEHPLIAAFMNPAHADISNPVLWIAEGDVTYREGQLKCGCKKLTTIKRTRLPRITQEQRVRISIHCALAQSKDRAFEKWAKDWLSGKDRSAGTAEAQAEAAWAAARAAEAAWAAAAARVARAVEAAWAWAVSQDREAEARAEAWAARAAAWAARAAAAMAEAEEDFDLLSIIKHVLEDDEQEVKP